MSKERLSELGKLLRQQQEDIQKTYDEIDKLKQSMRNSDASLYKGCLFYSSETYWDDLELSHECYEFVYVFNVLTSHLDTPVFDVLIIETTDEFFPKYLNIKTETLYDSKKFNDMREAGEQQRADLKSAFQWKLEDVLKRLPELKEVIDIKGETP